MAALHEYLTSHQCRPSCNLKTIHTNLPQLQETERRLIPQSPDGHPGPPIIIFCATYTISGTIKCSKLISKPPTITNLPLKIG